MPPLSTASRIGRLAIPYILSCLLGSVCTLVITWVVLKDRLHEFAIQRREREAMDSLMTKGASFQRGFSEGRPVTTVELPERWLGDNTDLLLLRSVRNLEYVTIWCNLSEEGLRQLASLECLKSVDVSDSKLTRTQRKELPKLLPGIEICDSTSRARQLIYED